MSSSREEDVRVLDELESSGGGGQKELEHYTTRERETVPSLHSNSTHSTNPMHEGDGEEEVTGGMTSLDAKPAAVVAGRSAWQNPWFYLVGFSFVGVIVGAIVATLPPASNVIGLPPCFSSDFVNTSDYLVVESDLTLTVEGTLCSSDIDCAANETCVPNLCGGEEGCCVEAVTVANYAELRAAVESSAEIIVLQDIPVEDIYSFTESLTISAPTVLVGQSQLQEPLTSDGGDSIALFQVDVCTPFALKSVSLVRNGFAPVFTGDTRSVQIEGAVLDEVLCGLGWMRDSQVTKCMQIVPSTSASSWSQAEASCRQFGGTLLAIESQEEAEMIDLFCEDCLDVWIGGTVTAASQVLFTTGTVAPEAVATFTTDQETTQVSSCVALGPVLPGLWIAEDCNTAKPYLCQKPLSASTVSSDFSTTSNLLNREEISQIADSYLSLRFMLTSVDSSAAGVTTADFIQYANEAEEAFLIPLIIDIPVYISIPADAQVREVCEITALRSDGSELEVVISSNHSSNMTGDIDNEKLAFDGDETTCFQTTPNEPAELFGMIRFPLGDGTLSSVEVRSGSSGLDGAVLEVDEQETHSLVGVDTVYTFTITLTKFFVLATGVFDTSERIFVATDTTAPIEAIFVPVEEGQVQQEIFASLDALPNIIHFHRPDANASVEMVVSEVEFFTYGATRLAQVGVEAMFADCPQVETVDNPNRFEYKLADTNDAIIFERDFSVDLTSNGCLQLSLFTHESLPAPYKLKLTASAGGANVLASFQDQQTEVPANVEHPIRPKTELPEIISISPLTSETCVATVEITRYGITIAQVDLVALAGVQPDSAKCETFCERLVTDVIPPGSGVDRCSIVRPNDAGSGLVLTKLDVLPFVSGCSQLAESSLGPAEETTTSMCTEVVQVLPQVSEMESAIASAKGTYSTILLTIVDPTKVINDTSFEVTPTVVDFNTDSFVPDKELRIHFVRGDEDDVVDLINGHITVPLHTFVQLEGVNVDESFAVNATEGEASLVNSVIRGGLTCSISSTCSLVSSTLNVEALLLGQTIIEYTLLTTASENTTFGDTLILESIYIDHSLLLVPSEDIGGVTLREERSDFFPVELPDPFVGSGTRVSPSVNISDFDACSQLCEDTTGCHGIWFEELEDEETGEPVLCQLCLGDLCEPPLVEPFITAESYFEQQKALSLVEYPGCLAADPVDLFLSFPSSEGACKVWCAYYELCLAAIYVADTCELYFVNFLSDDCSGEPEDAVFIPRNEEADVVLPNATGVLANYAALRRQELKTPVQCARLSLLDAAEDCPIICDSHIHCSAFIVTDAGCRLLLLSPDDVLECPEGWGRVVEEGESSAGEVELSAKAENVFVSLLEQFPKFRYVALSRDCMPLNVYEKHVLAKRSNCQFLCDVSFSCVAYAFAEVQDTTLRETCLLMDEVGVDDVYFPGGCDPAFPEFDIFIGYFRQDFRRPVEALEADSNATQQAADFEEDSTCDDILPEELPTEFEGVSSLDECKTLCERSLGCNRFGYDSAAGTCLIPQATLESCAIDNVTLQSLPPPGCATPDCFIQPTLLAATAQCLALGVESCGGVVKVAEGQYELRFHSPVIAVAEGTESIVYLVDCLDDFTALVEAETDVTINTAYSASFIPATESNPFIITELRRVGGEGDANYTAHFPPGLFTSFEFCTDKDISGSISIVGELQDGTAVIYTFQITKESITIGEVPHFRIKVEAIYNGGLLRDMTADVPQADFNPSSLSMRFQYETSVGRVTWFTGLQFGVFEQVEETAGLLSGSEMRLVVQLEKGDALCNFQPVNREKAVRHPVLPTVFKEVGVGADTDAAGALEQQFSLSSTSQISYRQCKGLAPQLAIRLTTLDSSIIYSLTVDSIFTFISAGVNGDILTIDPAVINADDKFAILYEEETHEVLFFQNTELIRSMPAVQAPGEKLFAGMRLLALLSRGCDVNIYTEVAQGTSTVEGVVERERKVLGCSGNSTVIFERTEAASSEKKINYFHAFGREVIKEVVQVEQGIDEVIECQKLCDIHFRCTAFELDEDSLTPSCTLLASVSVPEEDDSLLDETELEDFYIATTNLYRDVYTPLPSTACFVDEINPNNTVLEAGSLSFCREQCFVAGNCRAFIYDDGNSRCTLLVNSAFRSSDCAVTSAVSFLETFERFYSSAQETLFGSNLIVPFLPNVERRSCEFLCNIYESCQTIGHGTLELEGQGTQSDSCFILGRERSTLNAASDQLSNLLFNNGYFKVVENETDIRFFNSFDVYAFTVVDGASRNIMCPSESDLILEVVDIDEAVQCEGLCESHIDCSSLFFSKNGTCRLYDRRSFFEVGASCDVPEGSFFMVSYAQFVNTVPSFVSHGEEGANGTSNLCISGNNSEVDGVLSTFQCEEICTEQLNCEAARFVENEQRCYLFDAGFELRVCTATPEEGVVLVQHPNLLFTELPQQCISNRGEFHEFTAKSQEECAALCSVWFDCRLFERTPEGVCVLHDSTEFQPCEELGQGVNGNTSVFIYYSDSPYSRLDSTYCISTQEELAVLEDATLEACKFVCDQLDICFAFEFDRLGRCTLFESTDFSSICEAAERDLYISFRDVLSPPNGAFTFHVALGTTCIELNGQPLDPEPGTLSAEECETLCLNTTGCEGFEHAEALGSCALLTRTGDTLTNVQYLTDTDCAEPSSRAFFRARTIPYEIQQVKLQAADLLAGMRFEDKFNYECISLCQKHPFCRAFKYFKLTRECELYKAQDGTLEAAGPADNIDVDVYVDANTFLEISTFLGAPREAMLQVYGVSYAQCAAFCSVHDTCKVFTHSEKYRLPTSQSLATRRRLMTPFIISGTEFRALVMKQAGRLDRYFDVTLESMVVTTDNYLEKEIFLERSALDESLARVVFSVNNVCIKSPVGGPPAAVQLGTCTQSDFFTVDEADRFVRITDPVSGLCLSYPIESVGEIHQLPVEWEDCAKVGHDSRFTWTSEQMQVQIADPFPKGFDESDPQCLSVLGGATLIPCSETSSRYRIYYDFESRRFVFQKQFQGIEDCLVERGGDLVPVPCDVIGDEEGRFVVTRDGRILEESTGLCVTARKGVNITRLETCDENDFLKLQQFKPLAECTLRTLERTQSGLIARSHGGLRIRGADLQNLPGGIGDFITLFYDYDNFVIRLDADPTVCVLRVEQLGPGLLQAGDCNDPFLAQWDLEGDSDIFSFTLSPTLKLVICRFSSQTPNVQVSTDALCPLADYQWMMDLREDRTRGPSEISVKQNAFPQLEIDPDLIFQVWLDSEHGRQVRSMLSKFERLRERVSIVLQKLLDARQAMDEALSIVSEMQVPIDTVSDITTQTASSFKSLGGVLKLATRLPYVGPVAKVFQRILLTGENGLKKGKVVITRGSKVFDTITEPIETISNGLDLAITTVEEPLQVLDAVTSMLARLNSCAFFSGVKERIQKAEQVVKKVVNGLDLADNAMSVIQNSFNVLNGIKQNTVDKVQRPVKTLIQKLGPVTNVVKKLSFITTLYRKKICLKVPTFAKKCTKRRCTKKRCKKIFKRTICLPQICFPRICIPFPKLVRKCFSLEDIGRFLEKIINAIKRIPLIGRLITLLERGIEKIVAAIFGRIKIPLPSFALNFGFIEVIRSGLTNAAQTVAAKIFSIEDQISGFLDPFVPTGFDVDLSLTQFAPPEIGGCLSPSCALDIAAIAPIAQDVAGVFIDLEAALSGISVETLETFIMDYYSGIEPDLCNKFETISFPLSEYLPEQLQAEQCPLGEPTFEFCVEPHFGPGSDQALADLRAVVDAVLDAPSAFSTLRRRLRALAETGLESFKMNLASGDLPEELAEQVLAPGGNLADGVKKSLELLSDEYMVFGTLSKKSTRLVAMAFQLIETSVSVSIDLVVDTGFVTGTPTGIHVDVSMQMGMGPRFTIAQKPSDIVQTFVAATLSPMSAMAVRVQCPESLLEETELPRDQPQQCQDLWKNKERFLKAGLGPQNDFVALLEDVERGTATLTSEKFRRDIKTLKRSAKRFTARAKAIVQAFERTESESTPTLAPTPAVTEEEDEGFLTFFQGGVSLQFQTVGNTDPDSPISTETTLPGGEVVSRGFSWAVSAPLTRDSSSQPEALFSLLPSSIGISGDMDTKDGIPVSSSVALDFESGDFFKDGLCSVLFAEKCRTTTTAEAACTSDRACSDAPAAGRALCVKVFDSCYSNEEPERGLDSKAASFEETVTAEFKATYSLTTSLYAT